MAWLKIPPSKYEIVTPGSMVSCCQLEVTVKQVFHWQKFNIHTNVDFSFRVEDLLLCSTVDNREKYAPLRILSFDIECNVPDSNDDRFSDPRCDPVIQIGNMVSHYGSYFSIQYLVLSHELPCSRPKCTFYPECLHSWNLLSDIWNKSVFLRRRIVTAYGMAEVLPRSGSRYCNWVQHNSIWYSLPAESCPGVRTTWFPILWQN